MTLLTAAEEGFYSSLLRIAGGGEQMQHTAFGQDVVTSISRDIDVVTASISRDSSIIQDVTHLSYKT